MRLAAQLLHTNLFRSVRSVEVRKMRAIISLFLVLAPFGSFAESNYDWTTGNSYNTQRNFDGSTTTRGMNWNTGSTWTTTTSPNGNMRGTDSRGNAWNYNSGTGSYFNYGTGKSCYGVGAYRACN